MKKLFCFGYGYTCDYLGYTLTEAGAFQIPWALAGTTRDEGRKQVLKQRGVDAYLFDADMPLSDPERALSDVTHLLISTPPGDEGDPAFLAHADTICNMPKLEWLGYLSTTGVYGNRDGEWVDENSSLTPTSRRGQRRVEAERQWMQLLEMAKVPTHIFRLAGIYGPGRSALDSIRAGVARRIDKPGHAFSRIHVEDIVQILIASMNNPQAGGVYNVCDDEPVPSHVVIDYACQLLGRPSPPLIPYEEADLAPITDSFYQDNKRVKNERLKSDLGIALKYPSYREGLQACLEAEDYALSIFGQKTRIG